MVTSLDEAMILFSGDLTETDVDREKFEEMFELRVDDRILSQPEFGNYENQDLSAVSSTSKFATLPICGQVHALPPSSTVSLPT